MNETEARELFAGASDQPVPELRFTIDDVVMADARRHRRLVRASAAVASVVVVAAIVLVPYLLAQSTGDSPAVEKPPTTSDTDKPPTLDAVLDGVSLPPGAVRGDRSPLAVLNAGNPAGEFTPNLPSDLKTETRFWTSTASVPVVVAWLTSHPVDRMPALTPLGKAGNIQLLDAHYPTSA